MDDESERCEPGKMREQSRAHVGYADAGCGEFADQRGKGGIPRAIPGFLTEIKFDDQVLAGADCGLRVLGDLIILGETIFSKHCAWHNEGLIRQPSSPLVAPLGGELA
jgi:hypothetical protein